MNTSRRNFIASASVLAMPGAALAAPQEERAKPLRVCVFADIHYQPGVYVNDTPVFLEKILARAENARCDMVIHLGDFVHNVLKAPEKAYVKMFNESRVPSCHCLGNHDSDDCPLAATLEAYKMRQGHYFFDKGGFRFVVCDPNFYCEEPGKYIHFDHGNYHRRSKGATVNWIPPEQLEWLRETIIGSPNPCVVLSHQSFERAPNGGNVLNKDAVQAIFREANARRPGTVRLVMNGHLHTDNLRILDNILYWDVNSASNQWYPKTHDKFPAEYCRKHDRANHNIGWTEPLSAILSLWPDGRIRIDGSKADYLFGISPKIAGLPEYDSHGRYVAPIIRSTDMRFVYG